MRITMASLVAALDSSLPVVAGPAKSRLVRVQHLAILAALGHADRIVIARHGCRIEDAGVGRSFIATRAASLKGPDALVGVVQVDPLESIVIPVAAVELRGAQVQMIQIPVELLV